MSNIEFELIECRGCDIEYVLIRGEYTRCEETMREYLALQNEEDPRTLFPDYHNGNGEPFDYVIRTIMNEN